MGDERDRSKHNAGASPNEIVAVIWSNSRPAGGTPLTKSARLLAVRSINLRLHCSIALLGSWYPPNKMNSSHTARSTVGAITVEEVSNGSRRLGDLKAKHQ